MADQINSLEDLKDVVADSGSATEIDLGPLLGKGMDDPPVKVVVNGKPINEYFARPVLQMILRQPFTVAGVEDQFDVNATVKGGGLSGQAGAVKHGISKALQLYDPSLRSALKAAGFLTRDSRVVERKKYGKAKARKSFQFSKR